jgi:hypothetical protein
VESDQGSAEKMTKVYAALSALRIAYSEGQMRTLEELIHADLFSDLLEQAEHLLESGYKDAAAVIADGVLEEHLRKLCAKNGIATTVPGKGGKQTHLMIDAMNAELARAGVYGKNDLKQVTAWAGIRNDAAHGQYGNYNEGQVEAMVRGIRLFLSNYPA